MSQFRSVDKKEIAQEMVKANSGLTKITANHLVNAVFEALKQVIINNYGSNFKITIRGFGVFKIKETSTKYKSPAFKKVERIIIDGEYAPSYSISFQEGREFRFYLKPNNNKMRDPKYNHIKERRDLQLAEQLRRFRESRKRDRELRPIK